MVKKGGNGRFVYRNSVWQGCDLLPLGVSSFGHMNGVHYQNISRWDEYLRRIEAGEAAVDRAYETGKSERLTRELILQLKLGRISAAPFRDKFGVSILETFSSAFDKLKAEGMLEIDGEEIRPDPHGAVAGRSVIAGVLCRGAPERALHLDARGIRDREEILAVVVGPPAVAGSPALGRRRKG